MASASNGHKTQPDRLHYIRFYTFPFQSLNGISRAGANVAGV